jgi:PAS domain S-box-containing protein
MNHTIPEQNSAERYRELFEEAPIAYHEIGPDGVILRVNAAECALMGYTQQEMVGRPVWEFVAPEDQERSHSAVYRKIRQQQPLRPFLRQCKRRDGRLVWLEIHEGLIKDNHGSVLGIRSALLDVTERHRAEEDLRDSQTWLKTTLQAIRDGVIATDALGTVQIMNSVAESLTGWREEGAQGVLIEEVCNFYTSGGQPMLLMGLFEQAICEGSTTDRSGLLHSAQKHPDDPIAVHKVSICVSPIKNSHLEVIGAVLVMRSKD